MAIETKVLCDVTGKELNYRDTVEMTTINVLYNDVREVDVKNEKTGKLEKEKRVFNQERYAFHICQDHSNDFIKHMQKFFDGKKKELGK